MKFRPTTHVPGAPRPRKRVSPDLKEKELRGLIELSRLTNAIMDRDMLLTAIMGKTSEVMNAEGASVILLDEGDGSDPDLVFHIAAGARSKQLERFRLAWGEGYAGRAAIERSVVVANDLEDDNRHAKRVDKAVGFVTRSLLAVPLTVQDRLIGVLEVVNRRTGSFDDDDVRFASAIASQVAVAIERASLAEANLKNQRMAVIGETIAGAAHCIKNIVNAVRGGSFILNKGFERGDLDKAKEGWEMLEPAVDRISALSLDMLTISKGRKPEYADADVGELVSGVCEMVRESAHERGVDLSCLCESGLPARLDKLAMERCVLNLVSNAVDACAAADGGRVEAACTRTEDERVQITVTDNGPGMSEDVKAKVFRPFFSTKGSKGTGLGLSVTRKIIGEHAGQISVESQPGEGTTFTIRIPGSPVHEKRTG